MRDLNLRLTARERQGVHDPWPEADETAFSDCEDAARTLDSLATNATAAPTAPVLAFRQRQLGEFQRSRAACAAWVHPARRTLSQR